ncbi:hypothetical protein HMPREF1210_01038 [Paenisporosarcina sp. HGH0030]|uniref:hypothetical protein n=1 Tax=Paenisporosarcina sp. HGH0030 TaxID=1078085 RepID=UPI00034ECD61|nr:hypothetical protein [Paenisporosarcina sp. HGH0030]EPD53307.1 hypothetical protein HMPREF1210_01038 [Paenisporosarcina sp. HGH0030]
MKNGRDGGFNYWKLNYRKKFIRTLWMIPVVIFLSIQLFVLDIQSNFSVFLLVLLIVTLIVQLIYTYFKWKSERQTVVLKDK